VQTRKLNQKIRILKNKTHVQELGFELERQDYHNRLLKQVEDKARVSFEAHDGKYTHF